MKLRPRNRAVRSTLAPATSGPGWAGLLAVMPPVQRRSLPGSNMNAATSGRGRRMSRADVTSTAMRVRLPRVGLRLGRAHAEWAGKNGCGVPVAM